jgi:hypothetical protein
MMEYWSVENAAFNPQSITPTLHYSYTPEYVEIKSPLND